MRKFLVCVAFSMCIQASAFAQLKPYPEPEVAEDAAQDTLNPNRALSQNEQHALFVDLVDRINGAADHRSMMRARADLLEKVDALFPYLERTVVGATHDSTARSIAAWALGERGTAAACDVLQRSRVLNEDAHADFSVAVAKGRCGDTTELRSTMRRGTAATKARSAVVLGMLNETRAVGQIQAAMEEASVETRAFYELALGLLGDKAQKDRLFEMLQDREYHLHASVALSRLGVDYVVFDLRSAARSHESLIRLAAVTEMARVRVPGSCEVFESLSADGDSKVASLSNRTLSTWRSASYDRWRSEGFDMRQFGPQAYCP